MITSYEKLKVPDQGGNNSLVFEVNYSDQPEIQNCQMLRITYPNGSLGYLKREHLMSLLFAIGRPEDQINLIPAKITTIRKYQTMLGITAKKDIKKGEKINVQVDIPLPPIEQEVIGEAEKLAGKIQAKDSFNKTRSGLYVPKA